MTVKKKLDESPGEPNADVIVDEEPDAVLAPDTSGLVDTIGGVVSIDEGPVEPETDEQDMARYVDEPGKAVTLGDVAALQGVGLAPDTSVVTEVTSEAVPFLSAGVKADLDHYGWAVDPLTGRKIVKA